MLFLFEMLRHDKVVQAQVLYYIIFQRRSYEQKFDFRLENRLKLINKINKIFYGLHWVG